MLPNIMTSKRNLSPNLKTPKRVTMQDIADRAGVGKMLVSNALNGRGKVAPATREKILGIASELNYIPNFAARALAAGRTGIIAIISGPINEPYYGAIVHLLEHHLSAEDFHLMLLGTPREVEELVTGNLAVDGAIVIDMLGLVSEFHSHPTIPCVSVSTTQQTFVDSVFVDLSASIEEALHRMLQSGRQRIAFFITSDSMALPREVRARTYDETMKRAGREPEIINVATDDVDEVYLNFKAHIEAHGCPDALLCQNDETAMCAYGVLRKLGYAVPADVMLVGCDGQHTMKYFDPPLSTIAQPMEEICELAWKFLRQRIATPNLPHQAATVQGTLIVRESLLDSADSAA